MLTARTGLSLYPDCLQPLHSTSSVLSPIELDAKKSPLALLAQTCFRIGMPDPSSSKKSYNISKSEHLKISDTSAKHKPNFKLYSKSQEKKDSVSSSRDSNVIKALSVVGLSEVSIRDKDEKKNSSDLKSSSEASKITDKMKTTMKYSASETISSLGLGLTDSYRTKYPVFPSLPFPGSNTSFPQSFLPALSYKTGTPIMCSNPYCISCNCTSISSSTSPLLCSSAVFPSFSSSAFTLIPYRFMFSNKPQSFASQMSAFSSMVGCDLAPALRNLQYDLGLGNRFHPYSKNTFPNLSNSNYPPYSHQLSYPPGFSYQRQFEQIDV